MKFLSYIVAIRYDREIDVLCCGNGLNLGQTKVLVDLCEPDEILHGVLDLDQQLL